MISYLGSNVNSGGGSLGQTNICSGVSIAQIFPFVKQKRPFFEKTPQSFKDFGGGGVSTEMMLVGCKGDGMSRAPSPTEFVVVFYQVFVGRTTDGRPYEAGVGRLSVLVGRTTDGRPYEAGVGRLSVLVGRTTDGRPYVVRVCCFFWWEVVPRGTFARVRVIFSPLLYFTLLYSTLLC